jgi:predicted dehydrogenase
MRFGMVETEQDRGTRIAVVGAGLIGQRHVQLITANPRCALTAVVDPDERAGAVADEHGAPRFADLRHLLEEDRPDGAIVATPNHLHLEHATACLAAGVPVLVEKPIAARVDEGMEIAAAADRSGVPLLVGHHRRHSPILARAQEIIAEGRLGTIVGTMATTLFAKPAEYFAAAPWRREPGGGPMLINLIHDVDALRTLVGEVEAVQAFGASGIRGYDVEESVAVTMRFVGGALGSVLLSDVAASQLSWEMTSGEDPAYPRHPDRDCYTVAGTQGTLGLPTLRLSVAEGSPSWHRPMHTTTAPVPRGDPLEIQLDHFCDVIRRRAEPRCAARDGVESLRVTMAIAEAAATGRTIECLPADRLENGAP